MPHFSRVLCARSGDLALDGANDKAVVDRSHEESVAILLAQLKHPFQIDAEISTNEETRMQEVLSFRRASQARQEESVVLSQSPPPYGDELAHFFFIRAPIRNNFLTVPVGSRFI